MAEFNRNLAVIIGINSYQNGIQPLNTAAQDARKLADILTTHHHYQLIHPTVEKGSPVLNEAATLTQLRQLLTETLPNQIRPDQGDRLLIYFAGHGITRQLSDQGPQGFLVPQDADTNNPNSLLPMRELYESLNQLECRHLLVILDCCFAGMFRWASTRKIVVVPDTIHWEHYHRFIKYPAWQVITSAAHNQEALDYLDNRGTGDSGKHSPFAEALFEGLLEEKADLIPDGVITTPELYLYLRDSVEKRSKEQQTPGFWPLSKHDRGEYIFQLVPDDELKLKFAPTLEKDNNPYRGLEAFEERHARFFFGREEVAESLVTHISKPEQQFTVVDGISGSGKSSLVRAGLLPKLKEQEESTWQILPVIRPGAEPYIALASVICPPNEATDQKLRQIAKQLQASPKDFHRQITDWSQQSPGKKLLLVIDQFEELITLEPNNVQITQEKKRSLFGWLNRPKTAPQQKSKKSQIVEPEIKPQWQTLTEILANALEACPQLHLIVTIRSDFSPRFQESALGPAWANARFVVRPMRSDELREAVIGPANEMALYFEPPNLVDRLVDEVAQTPGALPLLSFTLSELYLNLHKAWSIEGKEDRALTVDQEFDGQGGVAGLLARRANEEYAQLPDDAHRATMRRVMLRMVELEGAEAVKRRVPKTELVYPTEVKNERVETVLGRLDQARLIVGGDEAGEAYVEPAHDFLVRGWDRLQKWIQRGQESLILQRSLIPAASNWQTAKTDLWNSNSRLDTLKQIKNSEQSWLNKLETEFVRRSIFRKRRTVQFRWLGFGSLLVASFVTIAVVNAARKTTDIARQEAEEQRDIAVEREIEAKRRSVSTLVANSRAAVDSERFSEALISAVQAGSIVQSESIFSNNESISNLAIATLYRAYYGSGRVLDRSEFYEHSIYQNSRIVPRDIYELPGISAMAVQSGIAANFERGVVKIWDVALGELRLEKEIGYQPERIILLPQKNVFVTIARNSTDISTSKMIVNFWNIKNGEAVSANGYLPDAILNNLSGMNLPVIEALILSIDEGLNLDTLSTSLGTETLTQFHDIAFSPSLEWLAGFSDNDIILINLSSSEEITLDTLPANTNDKAGVACSYDGENETRDHVTCENIGDKAQLVRKRSVVADDIAFSQNGETVMSVGGFNEVKTWSLSGRLLGTRKFEAQLCNTLLIPGADSTPDVRTGTVFLSPEGKTLVVTCGDGSVKLWNISNDSTSPAELKGFKRSQEIRTTRASSSITFDRNLPIIGVKNTLNGQTITKFINLEPEKTVSPTVIDEAAYDFDFSTDGNTIATLDLDKHVSIRDKSGRVLRRFVIFEDGYNFGLGRNGGIGKGGLLGLEKRPRIVFSPSGKSLAIAFNQTVKITTLTGEILHQLEYPESVENLGFLADQSLVLIGKSATVRVFDRQTRELRMAKDNWATDNYNIINASAVSPDGNFIAIAFANNTNGDTSSVQVLDIANQSSHELLSESSSARVRDLSFDASSDYLLIGKSDAARIQMWDVRNRTQTFNEIEIDKRLIVSSSVHGSKEMIAITTGESTFANIPRIGTQIVSADGNVLVDRLKIQTEKLLFNPNSSILGAIRLSIDAREGAQFDGLLLWDFSLDGLLEKSCDYLKDYLKSPLLIEADRETCDFINNPAVQ